MSGKPVGVISVQSTQSEGVFNVNDEHLLYTLAANVSTALNNAQLFTEVQKQKKYSDALIQISPAAIVILDENNNVSSWNPAAEKLFGYNQEEALGQYIGNLVATNFEMQAEVVEYSRQIAQGEFLHSVTQRNCKDGRLVDVEVLAVPLMLEDNRIGSFLIYHDITETKAG